MIKHIWINLPVEDVGRSTAFFTKLGFSFNNQHTNGVDSACLVIGEMNLAVMLFSKPLFEGFTNNKIPDTSIGSEMLISFDAATRNEVDEMAGKVVDAGGTIYGAPGETDGWMYGFGFCDPDGHRWNMLYMDVSKMPKP